MMLPLGSRPLRAGGGDGLLDRVLRVRGADDSPVVGVFVAVAGGDSPRREAPGVEADDRFAVS
jgi:hypothetical protein